MEYNIKLIREEFKSKGIFYTPPELGEFMKSFVDIEFDLVDCMPDYNKSPEENRKMLEERRREVYGDEFVNKIKEIDSNRVKALTK